MRPRLSLLLVAALALAHPGPAAAEQILVFAAASLREGLDDFAARWQAESSDTVVVSYAGSGQLAQQIINGAEAQVFISAAAEWMDAVEAKGLLQPGTRRDLLGNTLVLIGQPAANPVAIGPGFDILGALGGGKLAMGMTESVPAGQYGKAALTSLGVWEEVRPQVAETDNVRAALALVSTGEATCGIVYSTDAAADPKVKVLGTFPADSHPPIVYPAALIAGASDAAAAFFQTLSGPEADAAFRARGFSILD